MFAIFLKEDNLRIFLNSNTFFSPRHHWIIAGDAKKLKDDFFPLDSNVFTFCKDDDNYVEIKEVFKIDRE